MINPRLNILQDYRQSYLVNARTASGEAVLKLDRDCDGQARPEDGVLVTRETRQSDWRPVKNVAELDHILKSTPPKEKGHLLGLWRDQRNWLIQSPDGEVQSREVVTFAGPSRHEGWTLRVGTPRHRHSDDQWNTEKFHHMEEDLHYQYQVPESTGYYYTQVDPEQVKIGQIDTPAGPQAVFQEGRVISRCRVEQVTAFAQDGKNWVPMGFKDIEFRGVLDY